jgi:hypothetical protein
MLPHFFSGRGGAPVSEARAARRIVEAALQHAGWPWNARLSRWLDALVLLEEAGR